MTKVKPLNKMTLVELREEALARGLKYLGAEKNKQTIIQQINILKWQEKDAKDKA